MPLPLSGLLVVSLEQAVAAPMCTCRLADAGARVIKVERPEGDFARYYDKLAVPRTPTSPRLRGEVATRSVAGEGGSPSHRVLGDFPSPPPSPRKRGEGAHRASRVKEEGQSAYFVWLNRGKESLVLDLASDDDKALLAAIIAKADVLVQNLKPGAIAKLGFPLEKLRRAHPRLVICSISGYGEEGPYAARKAYDMLVQAESGLASVTGGPEAPARVGVSVCDIAAGMYAYEAILEALYAREKSGDGAAISPYGAFKTRDGADILISIQSDREWRVLAEKVLGDKALAADPAFATNVERVKRRGETDARVAAVFGATDEAALTRKLAENDIAFARVNDTGDLAVHPQLSRIEVGTPSGVVSYPSPPARSDGAVRRYGAVPSLGEHTAKIRAEFMPGAKR